MKATLQVINQMVADKVIADYAIGGAIGAIAYLEPFLTQDVDVFISFSSTSAGLSVVLYSWRVRWVWFMVSVRQRVRLDTC